MNKVLSIVSSCAILFLFILFSSILRMEAVERTEQQQLKLEAAINFAADAAILMLLENSTDLAITDEYTSNVKLNPEIALNVFVDTFLLNYNLRLTDENRLMVRTRFLPVFAVIADDGYYLATLQKIDTSSAFGDGYDLVFSPKYPFTWVSGTTVYGLTLSQVNYYRIQNGNYSYGRMSLPAPLNSAQAVQREINLIVTNHIANELKRMNQSNEYWQSEFFIPADLTSLNNVNPIQGISVLAIMQNVDLESTKKLASLSLGGTRIEKARYVVGYNGRPGRAGKLYCYSDKAPTNITVVEVFNSPQEAAQRGYYCDEEYMFKEDTFKDTGTVLN